MLVESLTARNRRGGLKIGGTGRFWYLPHLSYDAAAAAAETALVLPSAREIGIQDVVYSFDSPPDSWRSLVTEFPTSQRSGQDASFLTSLAFKRDLLTELLLKPSPAPARDHFGLVRGIPGAALVQAMNFDPWAGVSRLVGRVPSRTARLRMSFEPFDLAPPRSWQTQGLDAMVGFGIGSVDESELPHLVMFAEQENNAVKALAGQLSSSGTPTRVVAGVSFKSAARPAGGGSSIGLGSPQGTSGTLGCVVAARADQRRYALTCNHVIAQLNNGRRREDPVWSPGAEKGGSPTDRLGVLYDFERIDFEGGDNMIDCALAAPDNPADLDPAIEAIGRARGINRALRLHAPVKKTGAATGHTTGKYRYQVNTTITYPNGKSALFRNLIGVVGLDDSKSFAAQGDSGAMLLDADNAVAGQIISVAAGIDFTLASPIAPVLDHFQVDLV